MRDSTNMTAISAPTTLPFDQHRCYLAIQAAGGAVTVTISGGASFTVADGAWWGPQPAPINEIVVAGSGTIITG